MFFGKSFPHRFWLFCWLPLCLGLAACSLQPPTPIVEPLIPSEQITPTSVAPTASLPSVTEVNQATNPPSQPVVPTEIPTPTPVPIMGIETHSLTEAFGLTMVEQAKPHWIRRNALLWADVEPQEGVRSWEAAAGLESELQTAAELGFEVVLIVREAPTWARQLPGLGCGPVREDKLQAFANFMREAVARYSMPPYNVKYWEMGNEPDVARQFIAPGFPFGCWGDANDAYYGGGYYAEMLKAVYPQVKVADPQSQVLVGGLLLDCDPVNPPEEPAGSGRLKDCNPSRFLEGALENGAGDYFDGVSFHAYDYYWGELGVYQNPNWHSSWDLTGPVLIAKARYLRDLLASYGHTDKFLMNTEVALICGRDGTEAPCQTEEFDLTKAYYVPQAYASALAEGLAANFWYSLFGWRGSQLLGYQNTPLLVYDAYRFASSQFRGASYTGALDQFPGTRGYEISRGDLRVWILWSADGEPHAIQLPSLPTAVYDVFGAPITASQELRVTIEPVYVEMSP